VPRNRSRPLPKSYFSIHPYLIYVVGMSGATKPLQLKEHHQISTCTSIFCMEPSLKVITNVELMLISKLSRKNILWNQSQLCTEIKAYCIVLNGGRDSSVGVATGYGLDGPGIESRWGARFSPHVQTGAGGHPASCTMGTGSFPGVKRPESGADHPPPSSDEVKKE
jgi:hypothetical protein